MSSAQRSTPRVLMVGESWIKHTVHLKGFDQFHTTEYEEGAGVFLGALRGAGIEIDYIRAHEVSARFPKTRADLERYDVVVLSDIGSNSFLLCDETFLRSERTVNRLVLLSDYVTAGGGLLMIGGYMSFSGFEGKARYWSTPLAAALPVGLLGHDDRVEAPDGVTPAVTGQHPVLDGLDDSWPWFLGYNRVTAKPGASVVMQVDDDPFLVVGNHGRGRTAAFASDCSPHWGSPAFLAWPDCARFWSQLVTWLGGAGA